MADYVSERKDSGSATLNVRIDRETVRDLKALSTGPKKMGATIERTEVSTLAQPDASPLDSVPFLLEVLNAWTWSLPQHESWAQRHRLFRPKPSFYGLRQLW